MDQTRPRPLLKISNEGKSTNKKRGAGGMSLEHCQENLMKQNLSEKKKSMSTPLDFKKWKQFLWSFFFFFHYCLAVAFKQYCLHTRFSYIVKKIWWDKTRARKKITSTPIDFSRYDGLLKNRFCCYSLRKLYTIPYKLWTFIIQRIWFITLTNESFR